ncbi:MAG: FemAB family protein [Candidatus Daviesbacteria bacterium GW2011_GWF2_38_6]|uniref:FemAB family protein n=1 Tax=Candidatus Daviesbacteria bacterium GW2011_GWF2_38_6 TaxID=1618432 RepID=A0A0G0KTS4_9BACT|nr:MAG: FemAB family protein [Candidatus Daviesbacteria bacterium GW2011_GWF2_38_6]
MQSWQWGEFRKLLGIKILRYGIYQNGKLKTAFQITFHKIPFISQYVGYLPKGPMPDKDLAEALKKIGQEQNCAFIKVEPDIESSVVSRQSSDFHPSPKPLFTKYNFILDLTKSEEELLKNIHSKTRYNIRVAEKHGVKVEERTDDKAFEIYLKLYFETTLRQGYHGHNENYHWKVWQTLKNANMARLLIAFYQGKPLTAWMLLNFKDTLYYPYGGSSKLHPEVMANNLVAWEAIKLGKKLKLKRFDMWGADFKHGFHKFKQGYGGQLVEYIGTFDLVLNWPVYILFTAIDKMTPLKIHLLKLLKK